MAAGRKALVVATYAYADGGLSRLAAPAHDAESFASVLEDPAIAGFDVTMLVNKPHYEVGEAIADFYGDAHRDDLTLLYFTGHGVKDDEGRLYLAMTNTRRAALMFTAISAAQLNDAMDASTSRRKVLILDCCYSGAFPAGRTAKSDEGVQTLERFQGKGRAVLTASDATQYAFEGDDLRGTGTSSVFTRHLVEAIRSGAADLDEDGDIALDELYSYVYEQVVAEMPQQRPKKQEDVDGRILIARNVHWTLPAYLQHAIESPIAAQRLNALEELEHLHVVGNDVVRAAVAEQVTALAADDSRSVSAAATALLERIGSCCRPTGAARGRGAGARGRSPRPNGCRRRGARRPPLPRRSLRRRPPRCGTSAVPSRHRSRCRRRAAVPSRLLAGRPAPAAGPPAHGRRVPRWRGPGSGSSSALVVLRRAAAHPGAAARLRGELPGHRRTSVFESTVPWTLGGRRSRWSRPPVSCSHGARSPRALPAGLRPRRWGLALVQVEHASFWVVSSSSQNGGSYTAGPALWWLVAGWRWSWRRPCVVVLTRSPLAGRPTVPDRLAGGLRRSWSWPCLVWFVAVGPEADTALWWLAHYVDGLAPGWGRAAASPSCGCARTSGWPR